MNHRVSYVAGLMLVWAVLTASNTEAVTVSTTAQLAAAIENANAGGDKTILLQNGTYTLDNMLWVSAHGVTVRSVSGNRDAVVIQGHGMYGGVSHVFNVQGDNFSVSDVTLRGVANHAVQLQPEADSPVLRNLYILDAYEQMVKIPYYPDNLSVSTDNGIMEGCLLEYSAGIGPQYYIGGIDAHNARNWIVRDNVFKGIRSPSDDVAEHAIHFWSGSQGTLVERNLIINCDRGIGFGLGDRGHIGGIIRNNMIYHDSSEGFADVGIGIESAVNTQVYNNTVYMQNSYPNAIEYRFAATTGAYIANNLTNRAIARRDGASGTATSNVTTAVAGYFVNASAGDLHLASAVGGVADAGIAIAGLTNDFDGHARPYGAGIDIGADEYGTSPSCVAPSISVHPQDQAISSGQTATLSVVANGTAPLNYQWYEGSSGDTSTPVGADSSTFTTPALTSSTSYWVFVSNACGNASSLAALLSIGSATAPHISRIRSRTGKPGSTATISGTGFSPTAAKNKVYFGTASARLTRASATSLKVRIPAKLKKGSTVGVYVSVDGINSNTVSFRVR
ncbi:MAG: IPT/TIG domain-containing protein [Acidobacteriota bacterium]